jgi:uncharacterized membrane protein
MATLIAITYPDAQTAKQAMELVDWANFDKQVKVLDACWMSNESGEIAVHPRGHRVGGKAALWGSMGLLVGALLAVPVIGVAAGAAIGAHRAKKQESQLDSSFVEWIKSQIANGGSAVVVLYEEGADTQKAGRDLAALGGTVQSTSVSSDELLRMQQMIDDASK